MRFIYVLLVFSLILLLLTVKPVNALNIQMIPFSSASCPFLTPQQIQGAYGFTQLYNQGLDGSGYSVAIIDAHYTPNLLNNINTFNSNYNLPLLVNNSNFFIVTPEGAPSIADESWMAETTLDVEMFHMLAPGAKIYLVLAPNSGSLMEALNYTINNLPVQAISISWGSSELEYDNNSINYYDQIFQEAYQKGINIFVASGDSGAYNGQSTLNVNFPASSPYVISVGGTVLTVSGDSYAGETAWNGSGGGFSEFFPRPSFQPNLGSYREVPDVAFNAGSAVCAYVNNSWEGYIGTSLAAPSWAALDMIIDQSLGSSSQLLPELYNLYQNDYSLAFHAISSGCNGYYCANGAYNLVTGIGSPIANAIVPLLSNKKYSLTFVSSTGGEFDVNGKNYSSTVTINFTYGQQVKLSAYNTQLNDVKYNFESYSGYIQSSSANVSFFVNSSGTIYVNFLSQFAVDELILNKTQTFWVNNGSYFNASFPLVENSSFYYATLLGLSVNGGPLIYSNEFSYRIFSPMNISGVYQYYNQTILSFENSPPGITVNVTYYKLKPLSNEKFAVTQAFQNGQRIFYVGRNITIRSAPFILNDVRYVTYNFSVSPRQVLNIVFYRENSFRFTFISLDDNIIYPSSIVLNNPLDTYENGSLWLVNSSAKIEKVFYDGINLLTHPYEVNTSVDSLKLNVSTLKLYIGVYYIPLSNAKVTLVIKNTTISNYTSFYGVVSFNNIPDVPYTVLLTVDGNVYEYSLSGFNNTIDVSPLIYQLYILIAIIAITLLIFVFIRRYFKR